QCFRLQQAHFPGRVRSSDPRAPPREDHLSLAWEPSVGSQALASPSQERSLSILKSKTAAIPEGTVALFFIQVFSTLGFAVLYSTLVVYATKQLHMKTKDASALMGVFGAFNYGLHLFGGYLGGRFLSNRNLFVGGMVLQVLGCAGMAVGTTPL